MGLLLPRALLLPPVALSEVILLLRLNGLSDVALLPAAAPAPCTGSLLLALSPLLLLVLPEGTSCLLALLLLLPVPVIVLLADPGVAAAAAAAAPNPLLGVAGDDTALLLVC